MFSTKYRAVWRGLLTVAFLASGFRVLADDASDIQKEIDQRKANMQALLTDLEKTIANGRKEIDRLTSEQGRVQGEIAATKAKIEELLREQKTLSAQEATLIPAEAARQLQQERQARVALEQKLQAADQAMIALKIQLEQKMGGSATPAGLDQALSGLRRQIVDLQTTNRFLMDANGALAHQLRERQDSVDFLRAELAKIRAEKPAENPETKKLVERLQAESETLATRAKMAEEQLATVRSDLKKATADIPDLKQQIEKLMIDRSAQASRAQSAEEQLVASRADLKKAADEMPGLKKQLEQMQRDQTELQTRAQSAEDQLAAAKAELKRSNADDLRKALNEAQAALHGSQLGLAQVSEELDKQKKASKDLVAARTELEKQLATAQGTVADKDAKQKKIEAALAAAQKEVDAKTAEAADALARWKESESRQRSFDKEMKRVQADAKILIENANETAVKAQQLAKEATAKSDAAVKEAVSKVQARADDAAAQSKLLSDELEKTKTALATAEKAAKESGRMSAEWPKERAELRRQLDLATTNQIVQNQQVEQLRSSLKEAQSQIKAAVAVRENAVKEALQGADALKTERDDLRKQLGAANTAAEAQAKELAQMKSSLALAQTRASAAVAEKDRIEKETSQTSGELRRDYAELRRQLDVATTNQIAKTRQVEQLNIALKDAQLQIKAAAADREAAVKEALQTAESLRAERDDLRKHLGAASSAAEIQSKELAQLKTVLKEAQAQIKSAAADKEGAVREASRNADALKDERDELRKQVTAAKAASDGIAAELAQTKISLKESLMQAKSAAAEKEKAAVIAEDSTKACADLRSQLNAVAASAQTQTQQIEQLKISLSQAQARALAVAADKDRVAKESAQVVLDAKRELADLRKQAGLTATNAVAQAQQIEQLKTAAKDSQAQAKAALADREKLVSSLEDVQRALRGNQLTVARLQDEADGKTKAMQDAIQRATAADKAQKTADTASLAELQARKKAEADAADAKAQLSKASAEAAQTKLRLAALEEQQASLKKAADDAVGQLAAVKTETDAAKAKASADVTAAKTEAAAAKLKADADLMAAKAKIEADAVAARAKLEADSLLTKSNLVKVSAEADASKHRVSQLEAEQAKLRKSAEDAIAQAGIAQGEAAAAKDKVEKAEAALSAKDKMLAAQIEASVKLQKQIETLAAKSNELSMQTDGAVKQRDVLAKDRSTLTKQIAELEAIRANNQKLLDTAALERAALSKERDAALQRAAAVEALRTENAKVRESAAQTEKAMRGSQMTISTLTEQIDQQKARVAELERQMKAKGASADEIKDRDVRIAELEASLKDAERRAKAIGDDVNYLRGEVKLQADRAEEMRKQLNAERELAAKLEADLKAAKAKHKDAN